MLVSEIFHSVQGEGKLTGVPSVFVRASGCNLRCTWCDTPYASWNPEGEPMSVEQVVERVIDHPSRHVVLTGGEPMIMPEIESLASCLADRGRHITIETAATLFKPVRCDLWSLSPKLANSTPRTREGGRFAQVHEQNRWKPPVVQELMDHARSTGADIQLKFVVADEGDLTELRQMLGQLSAWNRDDVLLMPEGTDADALEARADWLVRVCIENGFRFCNRLHIQLFGHRRGT
jgi:7-carboxy-7-deazaguanine synthase